MLTGSKATGDDLILCCLEHTAASDGGLDKSPSKIDLFRRFHQTLERGGYRFDSSLWGGLTKEEEQALGRLASLDDTGRAILLLRKLEGFSDEEIAVVVRATREEVKRRLVEASKTMIGLEHHSVLIMEDEYLIARDLLRIVEEMGHSVCGVVGTGDAAVAMAAHEKPSLLLADLRLSDGNFSGMDAASTIAAAADIPVVFVTGYPEKAAQGFGITPFVVRKPFHPGTITQAVNQALARHAVQAAR